MRERLLILGGTAEATAIACAAVHRFGDRLTVITSLAGRLPAPRTLPGEMRVGGFGGADGLAAYLGANAISLLIDATHPFAERISAHAAEACAATGVPRLLVLRPPWPQQPGDLWLDAADFASAASLLPVRARRAFLAIGPGEVAAFRRLDTVWFLVRTFAPPPSPLPLARYEVIVSRPPFEIDAELALLQEHRIDAVVSKQSGGPTTAKITAARILRLPVIMIARPPKPAGESAATVDAALAWLAARLAGRPSISGGRESD